MMCSSLGVKFALFIAYNLLYNGAQKRKLAENKPKITLHFRERAQGDRCRLAYILHCNIFFKCDPLPKKRGCDYDERHDFVVNANNAL